MLHSDWCVWVLWIRDVFDGQFNRAQQFTRMCVCSRSIKPACLSLSSFFDFSFVSPSLEALWCEWTQLFCYRYHKKHLTILTLLLWYKVVVFFSFSQSAITLPRKQKRRTGNWRTFVSLRQSWLFSLPNKQHLRPA